MDTLSQSIELYRITHDQPPDTLDDLVEADIIQRLTPDPWGTEYELHIGRTQWAIRSAGPDQKHGTLDDLYEFGPVLSHL